MRRTIGLASVLSVLVLLVSAASAQAVSQSFWGIVPGGDSSAQDFNIMHQSKVGVARVAFNQEEIAPNGGSLNFAASDQFIGGLASGGVQTLPVLMRSQGNYTPPIAGTALTDWQAFAQAFVNRYKPGGTYWSGPYQAQFPGAPIKPITAYQVWNEPSLPKYFFTSSPVADYAKLLQITHDAILSAYPQATIVLAGLPGAVVVPPSRGWTWLNKLYGVPGVKGDFDVAAFHPYSRTLDGLPPQMRKFRNVMRKHGDKRTKVWITEFGYGSAPPNGRLNFGLTGQARMLRKTYKLFLAKHKRWKVRGVIWYQWRDPVQKNPDCSFCSSSGLLQSNYQPKPALSAFKHFTGAGP